MIGVHTILIAKLTVTIMVNDLSITELRRKKRQDEEAKAVTECMHFVINQFCM